MEQKLAEMRDEGMTIDGIEAEYDLSDLPTGYIRCVGPCRNKNAPMLSHTGTGNEVKLKLFNVRRHVQRYHNPNWRAVGERSGDNAPPDYLLNAINNPNTAAHEYMQMPYYY